MVRGRAWKVTGATVRGATHEEIGHPNQDAIRLDNSRGTEDFLILAVADGHGNSRSFRSKRGSVLAVEGAVRLLKELIDKLGPEAPLSRVRQQATNRWPRMMVATWRKAVRDEVGVHPFSPVDFAAFPEPSPVFEPGKDLPPTAYLAYGTTLLAAAITPRYIIYSQLGDGDILTVTTEGAVSRPLPRRHQFMANVTTSLCTNRAYRHFQTRAVPCRADLPAMLLLSTDGYANCFGDDAGFNQVGADLLGYVRTSGFDFVRENLQEWLRESSRDGSGDDITVGLAVRAQVLKTAWGLSA